MGPRRRRVVSWQRRIYEGFGCLASPTPLSPCCVSLRDNVEEYNTKWGLSSPLHAKDGDGPATALSVLTPRTGHNSTPRSRTRSRSPTRRRRGSKSSLRSKASPAHVR